MIYALVDEQSLKQSTLSLRDLLVYINQLSIPILQYRNKIDSQTKKKSDLEYIREHYYGKIIVNDTIELIEYADGIHLGQEDFSLYDRDKSKALVQIRQRVGEKIVGLSTHNESEILEANELDIEYIGLGAYRSTQTKSDATVVGEELLELAKLSKHPVALIGGVRVDDSFPNQIRYSVVGSDLHKQAKLYKKKNNV